MTIKKIKLNTAASNNHDLERKLVLIASGAIFVTLSLYVFFVGRTVFNIVERKTAESQMRFLSSNINTLQVEYMSLTKNIDLTFANSLGFKESDNTFFAHRQAVGSLYKKADEL